MRHPSTRRPLTRLLTLAAGCLATVGLGTATAAATGSNPTTLPAELATRVAADAPPAGPVLTFAGKVPGTNAYLAVVSRGGQIEAYVCDGAKISSWLSGKVEGNTFRAANKTNEVTLTATRTQTKLSGTVTLSGKKIAIATMQAAWPSGLYKAVGLTEGPDYNPVLTGWIVLPDGTQRGAAKVGITITAVGAVNPTGNEQLIGGNTTGTPVSSDPEAFKKKVEKKNPPPSVGAQCASLAIKFDLMMDIYNDPNLSDATHTAAGNQAHDAYLQGMALGCSFSPPPGGTAT
jgi:hypothetical protein